MTKKDKNIFSVDERFVIESVITEDEKRSWLHGAIDRMFDDKGFMSDNQCLFIYRHEGEVCYGVSEDLRYSDGTPHRIDDSIDRC